MMPENPGSVTRMIVGVKAGADEAVEKLWERYSRRIIGLARVRLRGTSRMAANEEDVANSAFGSFCVRAARGEFPRLDKRDDLWRLVARITARKAVHLVEHEHRLKRGSGLVIAHTDLDGSNNGDGSAQLLQIEGLDPTPEFAATMAEECQRLLDSLGDDTLRQVALWKADGYTDEEIAGHLNCSRRTVARKLDLIREMWEGELP